jgi:hypothetical protein
MTFWACVVIGSIIGAVAGDSLLRWVYHSNLHNKKNKWHEQCHICGKMI